jgi:hypothetical protein
VARYREHYQLYEGKPCITDTAEECRKCLNARVGMIGKRLQQGAWGDPLNFLAPVTGVNVRALQRAQQAAGPAAAAAAAAAGGAAAGFATSSSSPAAAAAAGRQCGGGGRASGLLGAAAAGAAAPDSSLVCLCVCVCVCAARGGVVGRACASVPP